MRSTSTLAPNNPQSTVQTLAQLITAPLILLLATALRFHRLSGQSLWADEGNSVALARRSFVEIAQRSAFDIHPPLYYWLLKIWITLFGDSEIGLRSLSAALGVGVVLLTGVLGTRLFGARVGLMAAFLAALSPFQVYYAQEARMYMLLTLLGCLTVLGALLILEGYATSGRNSPLLGGVYILTVTAGLYTHYAFPLMLALVNAAALSYLVRNSKFKTQNSKLFHWLTLQLIPLLLYLPWLPTAWRQLTTWPSERPAESLLAILETISVTLLFGHSWPYNLGLIASVGLAVMLLITFWLGITLGRPDPQHAPQARSYFQKPSLLFGLLWLWFFLPVMLTTIIFNPAFLKFLLVATPPLALLLALVIQGFISGLSPYTKHHAPPPRSTITSYLAGSTILAMLAGVSAVSLYHYYSNPAFARDNYRGIVGFIKAVGEPKDAIILHAEGQQDVFNYYFEQEPPASMPAYPLPRQRPLDKANTLTELQNIARTANNVYVVYWATQQADPAGLIEGWLDSHLYKATDQWYGNVRLVSYGNPHTVADLTPTQVNYRLGEHIRLTGYALSSSQITPGEILQLALTWETDASLTENYTVFVQVLDGANHLVGQRDAQPQFPAPDWPTSTPVTDGHGVFIEPGTPPGHHRVIIGLYNSQTGQRLPVGDKSTDFIELATINIVETDTPLPPEAFNIQVPLNQPMLEVTLLGYDLYKLGHRSDPGTPLRPGDPVHLVAYWTVNQPVQRLEDQLFIQLVTLNGEESPMFVTRRLAGTDYPIRAWQSGEIIRAQYDLVLSNIEPGTYRLALTLGVRQSSMQQVVALTRPFRVE